MNKKQEPYDASHAPEGELPCIAQALCRRSHGKGGQPSVSDAFLFTRTLVATLATNVFKLPVGPQTLALAWLHRFKPIELSIRDIPKKVLDNLELLHWAMIQESKADFELARANPDVRAVLVYIYYWDSSVKARKYRDFLLDNTAPMAEVKP